MVAEWLKQSPSKHLHKTVPEQLQIHHVTCHSIIQPNGQPVAKQAIYLSVQNHQSIPPSTHRSVILKPNEIKSRSVAYHQSMTCAESVQGI